MTITHTTMWNTDVYEVTEKIPSGYIVWNIGKNAPEGYLPVALLKPGTYEIRRETLKAVPISAKEYAIVSRATSRYGLSSKKAVEKAMKRNRLPAEYLEAVFAIYDRLSA